MMRWFRNAHLTFVAMREQARAEKAYLGNFWFMLLSRLVYNLLFLLFIDVLFQRVGAIAGYSKNDFLFMYFASQFGFYIAYYTLFQGTLKLVDTVRTGNFDLLLLKPVPHRAFMYVGGMQPFDFLFTLALTMPLIGSQVHWGELHVTLTSVALGAVVWLCGLVICRTLLFALSLPAFKAGDATDMMNTFYALMSTSNIPYGKLPGIMKALSLCILPQLVTAAASTEVLLQKGDTFGIFAMILAATTVSIILYQLLWRYALRNYTSASS